MTVSHFVPAYGIMLHMQPEWTLGDRLRKAMTLADLDRDSMAAALDVDRGTISRWCHDKNRPRREHLAAWSSLTGVALEWLESGHGRCGECRLGLGDHNTADPLCDHHAKAVAR